MSKNARRRANMPHADNGRRAQRRFIERQAASLQRKLSKMAKGHIRAHLDERAVEEIAKPEELFAESLADSD
jgi:hypothetical protein